MTEEKYMKVVIDKDVPSVRYSVEIKDDKDSNLDAIVLMMNPSSLYASGIDDYDVHDKYVFSNNIYFLGSKKPIENLAPINYTDEKRINLENKLAESNKTKEQEKYINDILELAHDYNSSKSSEIKSVELDATTQSLIDATKVENFALVNVSPFVQTKTIDSDVSKKLFLNKIMEKKTVNKHTKYKKTIQKYNKKHILDIIENNPYAQIIIATGELLSYKMSKYYFDIISSIDSDRLYGFVDDEEQQHLSLTKTGYTRHPSRTSINNGIKEFSDENYNKSMQHLFGEQDKKDKS